MRLLSKKQRYVLFSKGRERWKDKGTRVYRKYMQRCGVYYDRAMHHPVTTHPFCTHPLPEVDDVRLRGGVATATRNYARYYIHTGHIRGGGDRHAPRTSTGDCGEGRTKEKEAVIGAQRRQEGKKRGSEEEERNSPCDAKCFVIMMMRVALLASPKFRTSYPPPRRAATNPRRARLKEQADGEGVQRRIPAGDASTR